MASVGDRLISLESVVKQFDQQRVLDGVTAEFRPGTIGLLGPNGAGKTTLLRLLMGLLPPTAGRLQVLGYDASTQPIPIRERVGYMPEHECLIPEMSAVGFVAYMGRLSGLPREEALSRTHDVLQFVGLREERYRKISEYSIGMRQRVKLAQAIVHDPALCILDEPTAGLDPDGRREMLELVRALSQIQGHSLIVSTHLLPDVEGLCDQVLLLDAGHLLAAGPVATLLDAGSADTVVRIKGDRERFLAALVEKGFSPRMVGEEFRLAMPSEAATQVFEAAAATGTQIRYMGRQIHTLEDLFLAKVQAPDSTESL